jgi:hypothetical protein
MEGNISSNCNVTLALSMIAMNLVSDDLFFDTDPVHKKYLKNTLTQFLTTPYSLRLNTLHPQDLITRKAKAKSS